MPTWHSTERRGAGAWFLEMLGRFTTGRLRPHHSNTYQPLESEDQDDMTDSVKPVEGQEPTGAQSSSSISGINKDDNTGQELSTAAVVHETPRRSWRSYLWDTFDKSPEERRFLFKLDAVLMTLASLGYFIKYLDQVCLSRGE